MKKYARRAALFLAVLLALYGLKWGIMLFTQGLSPKRFFVEYSEDNAYRLEWYESSNVLYAAIAYWDDSAVFFKLYDNETDELQYRSPLYMFSDTFGKIQVIPTRKKPDCLEINYGVGAKKSIFGFWYDPYWYGLRDQDIYLERGGLCPWTPE